MEEIDSKTKECEDKLRRLGPSLPIDQKDRMQILYNMLMEYTEAFKNTMRGKYDVQLFINNLQPGLSNESKESKELIGGAKIKQMLNELYKE